MINFFFFLRHRVATNFATPKEKNMRTLDENVKKLITVRRINAYFAIYCTMHKSLQSNQVVVVSIARQVADGETTS